MLKFPLILLVYDGTSKLFSLESGGTKSLPVFTDASAALEYRHSMQMVLRQHGETRRLTSMLCPAQKACLDLLQAVVLADPRVIRLDVNPDPPGVPFERRSIAAVVLELDEVIQELRDQSSNTDSTPSDS